MIENGPKEGRRRRFDELEMNRVMLENRGARLRGVILNKVRPDKVEMIRDYFGRAVASRWGVPLLGVVPDLPFLGKATLGDLENLLGGELIAGQRYRDLHFGTSRRGYFSDESRRRRGRDTDSLWRQDCSDAATATRIVCGRWRRRRGRDADSPRRRVASVLTWIFRGDKSRRRRGRDVDIPWRRVAATPRPRRG